MKVLDTCFLIDLQREIKQAKAGAATRFLQTHAASVFAISVVTMTEFLECFADANEGQKFLSPFHLLVMDARHAQAASRIRRELCKSGQLIGDFDILIAATALAEKLPLVTNNTEHFGRVEGLQLELY